jgi:hypothetical protein
MGTIYRLVGPDGVAAYHEAPAGTALPQGAVAVTRWPGPFEDYVAGHWVTDHRGHANWLAGAAHIVEARAMKYAEALVILSGYTLEAGMLVHEAEVKGLTLGALAQEVLDKRVEFIECEVQRQQRQAGEDPSFTLD